MDNFEMMRKRLEHQGGIAQESRMIKDKYRTFLRTLKYSYQGCDVVLIQPREECLPDMEGLPSVQPRYRALINPNKNKADYDEKIISIDYATEYKPGDVFKWINTGTHWIIYLRELTEDAYFRGEIRRCDYKIKFREEDGTIWSTWASIRGPVETQIDSIQKNQIRVDRPNLSLNILLPSNEKTIKAFDRYKEFLFKGKCWRVEAPNIVSPQGVIEINAEEYFIDRDTDDKVNELKDGLVVEPVDPTPDTSIVGDTFILPLIATEFKSPQSGGKWCAGDAPVEICRNGDYTVLVTWTKTISGQFDLKWTKEDRTEIKTVVVESLM